MFSSKEIRWFSPHENEDISNWFAGKGIRFDNIDGRTDFYLQLRGRKDMGIKLREGNIEVKHLVAPPEEGHISKNAPGYFERYTKWSFSTAADDSLSEKIIHQKQYDWLEVKKERMGLKLKGESNGRMRLVSLDEQLDYGCQLEYTRISLQNKTWYTFGLEWFGDKELEVDSGLIDEILGNTVLNIDSSMGYAEFLHSGIFKT